MSAIKLIRRMESVGLIKWFPVPDPDHQVTETNGVYHGRSVTRDKDGNAVFEFHLMGSKKSLAAWME